MQNEINWNAIYQNYSPKLLGICKRYIHDQAAAEDVLQDSFVIAIEKQNQLREAKALFGWLKTIVVNNALLYLKKNGEKYTSEFNDETYDVEDNSDDAEFLTKSYSAETLFACIEKLSITQRTVFNLFFLEEYSHEQIASELDININTSKSHLLRAKKNIKTQLMQNQEPTFIKKKTIQLLVFLGFGNLLWAKNLQDRFSDFSVQPERELPKHLQDTFFIYPKKKIEFLSLQKKVMISVLIASGLFFLVWNSTQKEDYSLTKTAQVDVKQKNNAQTNIQTPRADVLAEEKSNATQPVAKEKTIKSNATIIPIAEQKLNDQSSNSTKVATDLEKVKDINKDAIAGTNQKILENQTPKNAETIDNKTKTPEKVVIVKKIIKRDTVYIKK